MTRYPDTRHASPQAWRRIWKAIGLGEDANLARDIANVLAVETGIEPTDAVVEAIRFGLNGFNWTSNERTQA